MSRECECGAAKDPRAKKCKSCADEAKRSTGVCSIEGCELRVKTKGMCGKHYEHVRRAALTKICKIEGCGQSAVDGGGGMCPRHYQRSRRHGVTDESFLVRHPRADKKAARVADENNRRARKKNAFVEYVDPTVVWERDGGLCHICQMPADLADWHLEHVVPLVRGGEHSYANCKVSHPSCNLRKGDR